ncbi:helix-turn-helix domain-containing protein [Undibacterium sp. TJN19]|uniref:helix-turn-helix domain-containing protein n=1 Tax=Undibacterium sp. TJN19 TaxID=3413055 RepID=UPI003BF1492A
MHTTPLNPSENPAVQQRTRVVLRLRELMAEHKIRSVSALHRILISRKVTVSHSQLLRIVDNKADHWKVEFLAAFIEVFNCSESELFKIERYTEADVTMPPS